MESEVMELEAVGTADKKKEARKVFSKIGFIYFLTVLIVNVMAVVMGGVVAVIKPELLDDMNWQLVLISLVPMYCVAFPITILLMKKQLPAQAPEKNKLSFGMYLLYALICLALAYIANIAGNIITTIIGNATGDAVENVIVNVATDLSPAAVLIYMVLMAPIMEEFLFRKLIVDRTIKYGKGISIFVSGLMFGLFHGNLNQFVYAFVIGCFFAFLYIKTGNIKISISLHMLFNFIGGFLATNLLNMIDLEALTEAGDDVAAVMELVTSNPLPFVLYALFALFVLGVIIAGGILFIVFCATGKFKLQETAGALPKKGRMGVVFGNVGMIVFMVFFAVEIILQLFGSSLLYMIMSRM